MDQSTTTEHEAIRARDVPLPWYAIKLLRVVPRWEDVRWLLIARDANWRIIERNRTQTDEE